MYFTVRLPEDQPTFTSAFVKCLPILYLIWFVWLQGTSSRSPYNQNIFYGLALSCFGDVLLIWGETDEHAFIAGSIAFGLAHSFFLSAFGWKGFGWKSLALSGGLTSISLAIILPNILSNLLLVVVIVYTIFCTSMVWRGLARVDLAGDRIPWKKVFAGVGAFLFGVSDTALGINKFCVRYYIQRELIMVTYYTAQLLLSLSVNNSHIVLRRLPPEAGSSAHKDGESDTCNRSVDQDVSIGSGHVQCLRMSE